MSALTEADIRAAVEARFCKDPHPDDVFQHFSDALPGALDAIVALAAAPLVESAANTLELDMPSAWEPLPDPDEASLWMDLRPSQAAELMDLLRDAQSAVVPRCQAIIIDALTEAGVTFAKKNPDLARTGSVLRETRRIRSAEKVGAR